MSKLFKAFTLIELLVVIAIIGILSGMIVISMGGVTEKANIAKSQVFSNSLRNSLMANIVGEWKFDELTTAINGTTIKDSWSAITGTLITDNTTTEKLSSDCVSGKCLDFDGTGDYITLLNLGIPANGTATIAGWFYFRDSAKERGSSLYLYQTFLYQHQTNDYLYFYSVPDYFAGPSKNKWTYLVLTYSGDTTTAKLYIDGVVKNPVHQGTDRTISAFANTISSSGAQSINGLIDDIRVYNAVIPISQIKELCYSGLNNLLANKKITLIEYQIKISALNIANK